jgi:hypothetical protein
MSEWGLAWSVLTTIWKFIGGRNDRPRLRITFSSGMKASAPSVYGSMTLLTVAVANVGRRPTSVTHVSLLLPRGAETNYVLFADPVTATYPVELKENQRHLFNMNEDKLKANYHLTPDRYVVRVDAVDRSYWSHGWVMRRWKSGRLRIGG